MSAICKVLTFALSLVADRQIEFRFGSQYRRIAVVDLEALVADCHLAYYDGRDKNLRGDFVDRPEDLIALGRRLYAWLDGSEGWLRSNLANDRKGIVFDLTQPAEQRELQPDLEALTLKVAHLPWELLHDGSGYLIQMDRITSPVRMVVKRSVQESTPANRPLQMLFMATSPDGVTELDHETEELNILEATEKQPLLLVTEESGSVAELGNLVASYAAGYFDVFNLTGHGLIYTQKEYGSWLEKMEPKPVLTENMPCFVTENEVGDPLFSSVADLARAFGARFPKVIFLSGCHTGEMANNGAVPSMAQELVRLGAEVVLGWARPVYDKTGILAAQELYKALAVGDSVEVAVQKMVQALLRKYAESEGRYCSDWHLLRVAGVSTRPVPALVTPLNTLKRKKLKLSAAAPEFLGKEPVASAKEFVGRRRVLQRGLKSLQLSGEAMGVFLHGMGGLGKSSVCARLCDRIQAQRPDWKRVVIYGVLDEVILIRALEAVYEDLEGVTEVLNNPRLRLSGRLKQFFELVEEAGYPMLLVLDDLEQNIPPERIQDASFQLVSGARDVLVALGRALAGAASRVMITCRYNCALPETLRLDKEQLGMMPAGDVRKQCQRLELQPYDALTLRLVGIADGNPRLLRWLSEVVRAEDAELMSEAQVLDLLGRLEVVEVRFRENILVEVLLGALDGAEKSALARWSLVQLPMGEALVAELVGEVDLEKLTGLTLVEPSVVDGERRYRVPMVLCGVLGAELAEEERRLAGQRATRVLYRVWWEEPWADGQGDYNPDRAMEVRRLGIVAQEWGITVEVTNAMALKLIHSARFFEARTLYEEVLSEHEDYRLWYGLARVQQVLGETDSALENYEKAQKLCPDKDIHIKSGIKNGTSMLIAQQGDYGSAMVLLEDALALQEQIINVPGKKTIFTGNYAIVLSEDGQFIEDSDIGRLPQLHKASQSKAIGLSNQGLYLIGQGDIDRAIEVLKESLEIFERLLDLKGQSTTLNNIGLAFKEKGHIDHAMRLWRESLAISEQSGNFQGKSAALDNIAIVIADQGNFEGAFVLWEQSLAISKEIGDVEGIAVTLLNMASVTVEQGNIEHALDSCKESLGFFEQIKLVQGKNSMISLLRSMNNKIGMLAQQGDMDRAILLWEDLLMLQKQIGDTRGKAATLSNFGQALAFHRKDFDTAIVYLEESVSLLEEIYDPWVPRLREIIKAVRAKFRQTPSGKKGKKLPKYNSKGFGKLK